jgi:hypothetical protein
MGAQKWRRLGHVFCADGHAPWMATHASYPTPLVLGDRTVRVFFSPRDKDNRSSITSLDLSLGNGRFEVGPLAPGPLLSPGVRGAFDDSGVTVSSVVQAGDRLYVYYLGWSLSVTVPFRNFIGLATMEPADRSLMRFSSAPIVERSEIDPFSLGYPWVLQTQAGWRMWYGSHVEWGAQELEMLHVVREAGSPDGLSWKPTGRVAIDVEGPPEFAISRPCVVRDPGLFRMWYSRRNPGYALGYAESEDGNTWHRRDDLIELIGPVGAWEDETVEYASIFDHGGARYMLYNGNGYGRPGFGLAVLE